MVIGMSPTLGPVAVRAGEHEMRYYSSIYSRVRRYTGMLCWIETAVRFEKTLFRHYHICFVASRANANACRCTLTLSECKYKEVYWEMIGPTQYVPALPQPNDQTLVRGGSTSASPFCTPFCELFRKCARALLFTRKPLGCVSTVRLQLPFALPAFVFDIYATCIHMFVRI